MLKIGRRCKNCRRRRQASQEQQLKKKRRTTPELRLRFKIKMNKKRALHLQLKNRIMLP
jgi:hypothetical protein